MNEKSLRKDQRKARLAEALKANLKRRKAKARAGKGLERAPEPKQNSGQ
jgi:hypothetical protein